MNFTSEEIIIKDSGETWRIKVKAKEAYRILQWLKENTYTEHQNLDILTLNYASTPTTIEIELT